MSTKEDGTPEHQEITLRTSHGIILVPQPSDDPKDPLNWPMSKKVLTLGIISFASFVGLAQSLANQSGFFPQALLYHKEPVQLSYSISAAIVGSIVGPLIWAPLSQYVGRTSLIFWGTIACLGCNVWSACMTSENQYIAFVFSRWLAGLFGSVALTLGAGVVLDLFFLHQRGKAFSFYTVTTLFGTEIGPTLSGFIVGTTSWPVQFWWCVGALGVVAILVFFFLEDTTYNRENPHSALKEQSYMTNRLVHFFPGNKAVHVRHKASWWSALLLAICPPVMLCGIALLLTFSWAVGTVTTLAVFLQSPTEVGGYAFTPIQNAEFTFCQWIAFICAETYGLLLNDRVPLWICKRRGGIWKPEYRLIPLLIPPAIALPTGLIIFGVGLQYHLHYMVLATGLFLVTFADMSVVPVLNNYVAESFTRHSTETYTVLWIYRLILGLLVPFFIFGWVARDGPAWTFGTMAILSCVGFGILGVLAWKGPWFRQYSFDAFVMSEEGVDLVETKGRRMWEETR